MDSNYSLQNNKWKVRHLLSMAELSPEALKPMRGDEQSWKLGYESLYVLTVGSLTERPLQQVI